MMIILIFADHNHDDSNDHNDHIDKFFSLGFGSSLYGVDYLSLSHHLPSR